MAGAGEVAFPNYESKPSAVPATPADRRAILDLFEHASIADPAYLPRVSQGLESVEAWLDRKRPDWCRLLYLDQRLVGHVAARKRALLPNSTPVPPGLAWEMTRLVVSPVARGQGLGTLLVETAYRTFGEYLWATCVRDGSSHHLLAKLGWAPFASVVFPDDPAPGLAMAPTRVAPED